MLGSEPRAWRPFSLARWTCLSRSACNTSQAQLQPVLQCWRKEDRKVLGADSPVLTDMAQPTTGTSRSPPWGPARGDRELSIHASAASARRPRALGPCRGGQREETESSRSPPGRPARGDRELSIPAGGVSARRPRALGPCRGGLREETESSRSPPGRQFCQLANLRSSQGELPEPAKVALQAGRPAAAGSQISEVGGLARAWPGAWGAINAENTHFRPQF